MKTLILVALFIPFVIRTNAHNYKFGDIIAFPRVKRCSCQKAPYKHYAVYVGNVRFPGKAPGQDIFHRTGKKKFLATCQFGRLSDESYHHKENYLDGIPGFSMGSRAVMYSRIMSSLRNCRRYNLLRSNCEHLATYVRYGKDVSQQPGTFVGRIWRWFRRLLGKPVYPIGPDYVDVSCRIVCRLQAMFEKKV